MTRSLAVLGLLVLLAGCGGASPTHFYTLAPVPPGDSPALRPGMKVTVARVSLPPSLDRSAMVTRVAPERLDVSSENRWAAPLDAIIRGTLTADLAHRLPGTTVIAPGDPMSAGDVVTVQVNVQQFIGNADGLVTLDADWAVQGSGEAHQVSLTRPAGSARADAIAAAMSSLLAELSDRIAAGLGRSPSGR